MAAAREVKVVDDLLALMAKLRDPEGGCPWDREQRFETIAPYTIEEAYEVADAIERGEMDELRDELGDLLFQVVFHAQMAREAGHFEFDDVVRGIVEKMTRRHPHVFGDAQVADAEAQTAAWEAQKARERAAKGNDSSVLDGVTRALPALIRAEKLQKRAARVGFDWPTIEGVVAKVEEELDEVRAELNGGNRAALEAEIGDLLFSCVNLARHAGIEPESALRGANGRFEQRFRHVETALAEQQRSPRDADLDELEALWQAAKRGKA